MVREGWCWFDGWVEGWTDGAEEVAGRLNGGREKCLFIYEPRILGLGERGGMTAALKEGSLGREFWPWFERVSFSFP